MNGLYFLPFLGGGGEGGGRKGLFWAFENTHQARTCFKVATSELATEKCLFDKTSRHLFFRIH